MNADTEAGATPEQLISYSFLSAAAGADADEFNAGNGLILPEYVLSELVHFDVPTPYTFELYAEQSGVWTHVTVREFTQPDNGTCLVPARVLRQLQLSAGAGERVMLRRVRLPLAKQLTVRATPAPRDYAAFTANLNRRIRQFICLTQGDVFALQHAGSAHEVRIVGVAPDAVHGVALIDEDETREVRIGLVFERRNDADEAVAKRTRGNEKSRTVLRLPDYDYAAVNGLSLENGAPKRVMWFMGWNRRRDSVDVLAVNPYSLLTRLTVADTDCDVCGEPLAGHPAEEFRFLPRTTDTLWPLASLAYHNPNDNDSDGNDDDSDNDTQGRGDGVRLPSQQSLDLRHLECQLAFAGRAFVNTGADYELPAVATQVPPLQTYPGQRTRDTLAWQQLPEPWLWALLLSQQVSFSVPGINDDDEDDDRAAATAIVPLARPFMALVASLAANARKDNVRTWAARARTVLQNRIRGAYASSAAVQLQRVAAVQLQRVAAAGFVGNALNDAVDGDRLGRTLEMLYAARQDARVERALEEDSTYDLATSFGLFPEMPSDPIGELLERAARADAVNIVGYLITRYGAALADANVDAAIYRTALDEAISKNSYKVVDWWIRAGPTQIDYVPAVRKAAHNGASSVVNLLLAAGQLGADELTPILINLINEHFQYNVPDEEADMFPNDSLDDRFAVIQALLRAGASVFAGHGDIFVNRVRELLRDYPTPLIDYADALIRAVVALDSARPTPGDVEHLLLELASWAKAYYRSEDAVARLKSIDIAWDTIVFLLDKAPRPPEAFLPKLLVSAVFFWATDDVVTVVLDTGGVPTADARGILAAVLRLVGKANDNSPVRMLTAKIGVFFEYFLRINSLDSAFGLFGDFLAAYLRDASPPRGPLISMSRQHLQQYIDVFGYFHRFGLQFRPTEDVLRRMHPNIASLWEP